MGTINEKINYLNQTKGLIKEAIINKGVEVSEDDTFRSYADKISNIKNGGTGEDIDFEEITIIPTTETQVKEGAFSKVTVEGIQGENLEIIPSTENQNFNGVYTNVSVVGDEDLIPENIKKGTNIFGVEGNASVSDFKITDASYLFYNGSRLENLEEVLNLCEKPTSLSAIFYGCKNVQEIDLSNLDTSEVTDMSYMLYQCINLPEIDLSNFDTSKVTKMNYMFCQCRSLPELDVSNFNTSNVTNMSYLFHFCESLTELDVSNFDTSNVTNMSYLFGKCSNLIELDLSNWDASKVENTYQLFNGNSAITALKFMKNLGKGYNKKSNLYSNYRIDLQNSYKLTRENLVSIMNDLYDLNLTYNVANGGTLYAQELTLGILNRNKLTPEDIAIATNKGWTVD